MESCKRKRDSWSDEEITKMLEVIKEKHILRLLDKKTKRTRTIYEDVVKTLKSKNIYKTSEQIRDKFKYLKCDYYKSKRNNKSCARQTWDNFEILDEMLSHHPALTDESVDTTAVENDSSSALFDDVNELQLGTTTLESASLSSISTACFLPTTSTITSSLATTITKSSSSSTSTTPSLPPITCTATKKNSYEKVVKNFTEKWKKTQTHILNKMKEQDENNWNALREHRIEIERILEKDRQEVANMLQNFLKSAQSFNSQRMDTMTPSTELSVVLTPPAECEEYITDKIEVKYENNFED